jgi:hypothetical protein
VHLQLKEFESANFDGFFLFFSWFCGIALTTQFL